MAANGKEHVLHMVGPGAMFAEVAAIGGFNCPANAEAIVPSVCALLPLAPFRQLLEEDHAVCMQMMLGLTLWVSAARRIDRGCRVARRRRPAGALPP